MNAFSAPTTVCKQLTLMEHVEGIIYQSVITLTYLLTYLLHGAESFLRS